MNPLNEQAPKIAVITGPTATGKTALGIELAKQFDGEVVSADSMQVYRRMDIGTAKPDPAEMQGIPHHMIDVAQPEDSFSVAGYVPLADACVQDILKRGKLPIVVGGTGLYIDSLIAGRDFASPPADEGLRQSLSDEYDRLGGEEMLRRLGECDPRRAEKLHPSDKKRILRALEIYISTGKTITAFDEESQRQPLRYDAAFIILSYENRQELYSRIDSRVNQMVEKGLFDEVRGLLSAGLSEKCTAMQAIGYKETAMALRGELSSEEAIELIKRESRRYAKRQLTWLGRRQDALRILWGETPDFDYARRLSAEFFHAHGLK